MPIELVSDRLERERREAADARKRIRYVIVHYSPKCDGYSLAVTNQGRFHYDDAASALDAAAVLRPSMKSKLGLADINVIAATCWESGDCCGTVFSKEYVKANMVVDDDPVRRAQLAAESEE